MAADKLEEKLGRATKVSPVLEFHTTLVKIGMFLSEDTDVFVITPNR